MRLAKLTTSTVGGNLPEIIKDVNGKTLRLTNMRLSELTGMSGKLKWYLCIGSLRSEINAASTFVKIRANTDSWRGTIEETTSFDLERRRIGCRSFSKTEFAKIMRAVKGKNGK